MKSKLVYLSKFSGKNASIYSILTEDNKGTFLDQFIEEYRNDFWEDVIFIVNRLRIIGQDGAIKKYFKRDEGLEHDDRVCALYDLPEKNLRLYCIRLYDGIVIVGNGGAKNVRTWQEDPRLAREVHEMMHYSKIILTKLDNGSLRLSTDGLKFEGNLLLTY
ncbi:MAG: hypothetical protein J7578_00835 [Chitinophagaceae bacterium]|nr:hypothetical protein [Chitinophagaceae bacterium]